MVQLLVGIDLKYVICQFRQGVKIVSANEGLRIKVFYCPSVAPENRHSVRRQGIVHLFRRPPFELLIFKGNGELVRLERFQFRIMTAGTLPAWVVGSSANRINLFSSVEFVKEAHPVFNRAIHIGGEERTEPDFLGENPIPVSIFPNQRVRRTVISKDREVVVTRIVSEKRKNSVVALLPIGAVYLVVCPNLDAVVETVALSGESIDEKLGPLFAIQLVPSRKDLDEKVLKMDGAVGKVNGKRRKIAHWPRASRKCR